MALKKLQTRKSFGIVKVGLLTLVLMIVVGCATSPKRRSAKEIYDDSGHRIAKATDTFEFSQIYPYPYDDVFEACYKALFRHGFMVERENRDKGILQGSILRKHLFSGGSNMVPFTVSIQIREISDRPRTQMNMVLDTHWGIAFDSLTVKMEPPSKKYGPELATDIQKVLSTFE